MKTAQIFGLFIFLMYFCTTRMRNVAVVAQWQSTSLVRKRSRVQSSSTARKARITVSRNPFFISAERPEDRQGTGGADGSGPPAAEMPNAKDAGRGGALAAETPNAEMHAGVRRPPRRRIPCGSLRKGGRFRQTKSDKTNNPKPDCRPISQYCAQNGLSKPIVCRNFAV